jgi:hypothetical protein
MVVGLNEEFEGSKGIGCGWWDKLRGMVSEICDTLEI